MVEKKEFKKRNLWLVIFWSFCLFIIMYTHLYLSGWIGTLISNASFEDIIINKYNSHKLWLVKGLVAFFIGIPILFIIVKLLWRRSLNWMR